MRGLHSPRAWRATQASHGRRITALTALLLAHGLRRPGLGLGAIEVEAMGLGAIGLGAIGLGALALAAQGCGGGDSGEPGAHGAAAAYSKVKTGVCLYESNAEFCARHERECGPYTGVDRCGQTRAVADCGACPPPLTCGGAGVSNHCGTTSGTSTPADTGGEATTGADDTPGNTAGDTAADMAGGAPDSSAQVPGSTSPDGTPPASPTAGDGTGTSVPPVDTSVPPGDTSMPPAGESKAAALAQRLRGRSTFLVGVGNDEGAAAQLGLPLDLHYQYLVGQWQTWSTDANGQGAFVTKFAAEAEARGMTPMFTLYQMADRGDGSISAVTDDAFMSDYWQRVRILFERLKAFDKPVLLQIEPDFWGYAFQKTPHDGSGAARVAALVPECAALPNTFAGMARCFLVLRDAYAPKVAVGLHVTNWGFAMPELLAFYTALGAPLGDFITVETLDRDAGCFEARIEADCQRSGSGWYWDESNRTSPNFHEHFASVKKITDGLGLPVIWWQTPLGVPSASPGSTGHYRDNRVRYFFAHVGELIAAGGVGAVFGSGTSPATEQTTLTTDGGQFETAARAYAASPVALP